MFMVYSFKQTKISKCRGKDPNLLKRKMYVYENSNHLLVTLFSYFETSLTLEHRLALNLWQSFCLSLLKDRRATTPVLFLFFWLLKNTTLPHPPTRQQSKIYTKLFT